MVSLFFPTLFFKLKERYNDFGFLGKWFAIRSICVFVFARVRKKSLATTVLCAGAFAVFRLSLGGVVFWGASIRIPTGFVCRGAAATRVLWRLFPFSGGTREARVSSANGVSRKPEIVSRSVPMKTL